MTANHIKIEDSRPEASGTRVLPASITVHGVGTADRFRFTSTASQRWDEPMTEVVVCLSGTDAQEIADMIVAHRAQFGAAEAVPAPAPDEPSDDLGEEKEPVWSLPAPGGATVHLEPSATQDPDRPGKWWTVTGVEEPAPTVDSGAPRNDVDSTGLGLIGSLTGQQRARAHALDDAREILGPVSVEELTTAAAFIVTGDVLTDDPDLYDEADDQ